MQDRYQALILPVATSGIHKHRLLLRLQGLYPEQYQYYKSARVKKPNLPQVMCCRTRPNVI